ncbi:MAG: hypothetical protein AB7Q29_12315 [Vicinamibacterales bacterium]
MSAINRGSIALPSPAINREGTLDAATMANTRGFKKTTLYQHWFDHHRKFTIKPMSEAVYERMADSFFIQPCPVAMAEGLRKNGDLIRFDPSSQHFGVMNKDGIILSFYPADPAVHSKAMKVPKSNADYFIEQIQQ